MPRPRRPLPAALALTAVLALAACGSDGADETSAAAPGATTPGTRTVEHVAGTTEVPVDPQRIVTTTDQNALLPLLELGVVPVASAGLELPDGGHEFRRTGDFDTSQVAFAGPYGELDLEAIAAQRPDLIVGFEFDEALYPELSAIAPTVLVATHSQPLPDALEDLAAVVGREEQAAAERAELDARLAETAERLAPVRDELTLSMVEDYADGTFGAVGYQQSQSVLADLDLVRPAPQRDADPDATFSYETVAEHDGDVMWLFDYSGEGTGEDSPLLQSPLWARLGATAAGQAHVIDGTRTVGASWAVMDRLLDELDRTVLAPGVRTDVVAETPA